MTRAPVNLRNLERIHESSSGASPKLATFLLGASGIAAVVVSGWLLQERDDEGKQQTTDPLAELLAEQKAGAPVPDAESLGADDLDFPDLLSDQPRRTTALVAVRDDRGRLIEGAEPSIEEESPPPSLDTLPTKPLATGSLLNQTPVTTAPKDQLTQLAHEASRVPEDVVPAEPGTPGGFQIQVASFKEQDDADRFVAELRGRGHQAFRQAANVPGRGVWHRVRIGPFKTKYQATLYKSKLEESERMAALVIDPDKVERQQQVRAAKLAERIRKYGSP